MANEFRIDYRATYKKRFVVQEKIMGRWIDSLYCETYQEAAAEMSRLKGLR